MRNLRYTFVVDGDNSWFRAVATICKEVYGDNYAIIKEECVGHDGTRYYVFEQEMLYDDTDVSFMLNNAWFQLVVCFRQKNSERNIEFLIHTSREVEKDLTRTIPCPGTFSATWC